MNKFEMLNNAINLGPVASKADIPVYPMMATYAAVPAGKTQSHIFESNDNWIEAMTETFDILGRDPDLVFPMNPSDVTFVEQLKVKIPGKDLPDDELFQFLEEELMTRDDYQTIIDKGMDAWQLPFVASIQNPPIKQNFMTNFKVIMKFIQCGKRMGKNKKYWEKRGVPTAYQAATAPAFDTFSMSRRMESFFYDLFDCPDQVKAACKRATPDIIKTVLRTAKPGDRVAIFAMRSSATFISPAMFEEFVLPYLKEMVETFFEKGMVSVLHCDGNWLPMLPYFKEFPPKSCIVELDGDTDIFEAKKILKGHLCIRGDVPANLLAFGTSEEVATYCDKLIELGMEGGLIIGSGCEVPLNAKVENMQTFLNCTQA